MDTQEILEKLKKYESKRSKTQEDECRNNISRLLKTSDGIKKLRNLLDKNGITEWVKKIIVSEIQSQLKSDKSIDKAKVTRLLEAISKNGNVDSDARWKALSVILDANLPNSLKIFAGVLKSRHSEEKDLSEKYLKYAFKNISPDGGLPYLKKLSEQNPPGKYEWLPNLINQVSNRLDQEKIDEIWLNAEVSRDNNELNREKNELISKNTALQEKIDELQKRKIDDREEIERLKNDKQRMINDANNAKRDFRDELGKELSSYFIEAKDVDYKPDSTNEKILLDQLRGILKKLEESGVIINLRSLT